jgi:hypothetical protein
MGERHTGARKLYHVGLAWVPALLARCDRHLRIEIEYPGLHKDSFSGLVRFTRPAPGMNLVAYSRLEGAALKAAIQAQIDSVLPRARQPFSWHVCEHAQPPDLRRRWASFHPGCPFARLFGRATLPAQHLIGLTATVR